MHPATPLLNPHRPIPLYYPSNIKEKEICPGRTFIINLRIQSELMASHKLENE